MLFIFLLKTIECLEAAPDGKIYMYQQLESPVGTSPPFLGD